MSPKEKTVIRAVIQALRGNGTDLHALSNAYGARQRLDNRAGRTLQSVELLENLIAKDS